MSRSRAPRHPARPAANASALILAALVLSGCSEGKTGSDADGEPPITKTAVALDTAGLKFPLDGYQATPEQRSTLDRAQIVLTDQCMRRYGFRYSAQPADTSRAEPENTRRYGVSSPERAALQGYAPPVITHAKAPTPGELSPNERLVLFGVDRQDPAKLPRSQEQAENSHAGSQAIGGRKVPVGGCLHEANLKLFRPTDDTVDFQLAQNLSFEAYGRSKQDSRVIDAIRAWSTCMAERGYHSDEPVSPVKDLGLGENDLAGPKAIAAAKQDVACKKKVNLVGVWSAVETAYQQRLIDKNAENLAKAKDQLSDRMRVADSLIK
ncbi:hypothetical protein P9869_01190 [Streptomyces ossamyceticus]|nr:hypothetical protein [Streptomyces ossamyceticus]